MFEEEEIVTDDAPVGGIIATQLPSLSLPPRCDSGFASGSLQGSLVASPQQQLTNPMCTPAVQYHRQESGFCEAIVDNFEQLNISIAPVPEPSPQKHEKVQAPTPYFAEYYEPDSDGDCQLHLAIASGFVEVVFALIRMAPHPSYLDIQNNELYAPLHIAVLMNQPGMVRRLVVAGATSEIRDLEGNTPLHLAAKRGYLECAEALLRSVSNQELRDAAVTADSVQCQSVIDLKNYHGEHCVHLATFGQHTNFLRLLSWNGADMNATEGRSGKTALHYAVNKRDLNLVGFLATGCRVNLNVRDWSGRTPLQCALINGDQDIVAILAAIPGCDTTPEDTMEDLDEEIEDEEFGRDSWGDIEVNGIPVESTA